MNVISKCNLTKVLPPALVSALPDLVGWNRDDHASLEAGSYLLTASAYLHNISNLQVSVDYRVFACDLGYDIVTLGFCFRLQGAIAFCVS